MTTLYDFQAERLDGRQEDLADYRGEVLLVVNVASECGFTPQYEGLQALQDDYAEQGFRVLGFPCNQFGGQEPGGPEEIAEFCSSRFGVDFPMFAKIEVNGGDTHPVYRFLKKAAPGALGTTGIKWNFTKFLVGRDGRVIERFAPSSRPETLRAAIERALAEPADG
ncbi:glutathione peroxidase [Thioalkalivibrio sp.]|uniref:glutathione peroxidase n=1 Tax=Thioalkalivibrio sp. TaxID=2093813 RepID=UPI0035623AD4